MPVALGASPVWSVHAYQLWQGRGWPWGRVAKLWGRVPGCQALVGLQGQHGGEVHPLVLAGWSERTEMAPPTLVLAK